MQPLISVYIPTCNRRDLLERAVNSVLSQTYPNVEIIISDDCSEDDTQSFCESLVNLHNNIVYIRNDVRSGACISRNKAIKIAKGEYITGLDDDDYFSSSIRLELFWERWQKIVNSKIKFAGLYDSVTVMTPYGYVYRHLSDKCTYQDLRKHNKLGNQIFAPKTHFTTVDSFDPLMQAWQDWDLWLRISKKFGTFFSIQTNTYLIDEKHDCDRITMKDGNKIRSAMLRLASKIEKISLYEKSSLIASALMYKQVKPTLADFFCLIIALRFKTFLHACRKL
ncbi:glycosyltransferase [Aeromonas veronii]|uniref:glycosyltransferase n=1 Tax=Aeromonas veronii TaxID=654 RepID=UPI003D1C1BE4